MGNGQGRGGCGTHLSSFAKNVMLPNRERVESWSAELQPYRKEVTCDQSCLSFSEASR